MAVILGGLGGGPPAGQAACGSLLPPWIPLPVRAWVGVAKKNGAIQHYPREFQVTLRVPLALYNDLNFVVFGMNSKQFTAHPWSIPKNEMRIPRPAARPLGRSMGGRPQGV
jgi:hypothetical protein